MIRMIVLAAALLALGACKDKPDEKQPPAKPAARDAAPPRRDDGVLKLVSLAPEIGMMIDKSDESRSTMKVGGDEVEETEKQVSHAKVIAVAPPAIAKIEIRYEVHEIVRRAGAQQEAVSSPLAGKTYQVWAEGDEIKATGADGKAVPDEELELLAAEHAELGKVPQIEQLLRSRVWKLGEKVDLGGAELAALGPPGGDPSVQPNGGSITWAAREGDHATFAGELHLAKDDERAHLETTLTTSIKVDVHTGRIAEIVASGTMKGEVKGAPATPIEGTLEHRTARQYGR
jgi:hypothetical protein